MYELLDSYRPASSRLPWQNAGRLRDQRARRMRSISPPEQGRVRTLRRAYTPRQRVFSDRTRGGQHYSGANARARGKMPRRRSNRNTNNSERASGGFQWHQHNQNSYLEGSEDFSREPPQPHWKNPRDNGATSQREPLLQDGHNNLEKPRMESTQQPEDGTVPPQGVDGWRRKVAVAAMDAEFCEGVYRGHSMETGRGSTCRWSLTEEGSAARVDGTPPVVHITSKPLSPESSIANPSKLESTPQSEPKDVSKDNETSNHGGNDGAEGGNDGDEGGNVGDDGDEKDNKSFSASPSLSSYPGYLDQVAQMSVLTTLRQHGDFRPAIGELLKLRDLRHDSLRNDEKHKSKIMWHAAKLGALLRTYNETVIARQPSEREGTTRDEQNTPQESTVSGGSTKQ